MPMRDFSENWQNRKIPLIGKFMKWFRYWLPNRLGKLTRQPLHENCYVFNVVTIVQRPISRFQVNEMISKINISFSFNDSKSIMNLLLDNWWRSVCMTESERDREKEKENKTERRKEPKPWVKGQCGFDDLCDVHMNTFCRKNYCYYALFDCLL